MACSLPHSDTADEIARFMLPMLEMNPHKRVTARRALEHAWLGDADGTTPLCTVASSKIWREERIRRKRMEEEAKRTLEEKRREEQSGAYSLFHNQKYVS